jgi:hypothetical protein
MLLQMPTEDIVRDLLGWRRQRDMKEWENSTAKSTSTDGNEWRRNTKRNLDRGRILICFHISDEKSKAIFLSFWWIRWSKPSLPLNVSQIQADLFGAEENGAGLYRLERQQNLAEITASDAKQYVYAWRRCVINHVPEEANERDAPFISNRADARLSSSSSGNFVALPSRIASYPPGGYPEVTTAVSSTPNASK